MSSQSLMSTNVHPWQRLRTVFVVGTLLTLAVFPSLLPSAASVAHAAAAPSGTPSAPPAVQPNSPATPTPGTVYTIPNCVQPPTTVDHATFTDAQLSTYGMPTRESFPSAAAFAQTVRAMKHRDCQYTVGSPASRHGENHTPSNNWAGYYEFGGNWSTMIDEWYLNAIEACNSSLIGRASGWGGIGGINGDNHLVQSGTDAWCDDPISGNPNAVWYQMWVENLGANDPSTHYDKTFQPRPGDLMESVIGGSNCYYMNVTDTTTGNYFAQDYGPCGDVNYFDCIEENDSNGLALNGDVVYPYCEGYDVPQSKWLVMGNSSSNYWDVTMVNQQTDAIPSSPPNQYGSGSFEVNWNGHN